MADHANKGAVARLPHAVRELINQRIRDGATDAAVAEWCRVSGHEISEGSIRTWRAGVPDQKSPSGYQRWINSQERLSDMAAKREFAREIVEKGQGADIHEAATQIAASQLFEVIEEFDLQKVKTSLEQDPTLYPKVLRALAALNAGGLDFAKFREHVAEKKRAITDAVAQAKTPGGITPETLARIEEAASLL